MFYKAKHPDSGNMWDVWLYHQAGTYYLYSLCGPGGKWHNFSLATSPDGVHWKEHGPVIGKDEGVTWQGTGSTWANPVKGARPAFQINYSSWIGPRQTIWFAQSDDLVKWTKCGKEKEFVQDERWYERNGRWDCIWTLARPGGGLYGYWTASPKPGTGGLFGFGESADGITWTALPPPKATGVGGGEVGAAEKIGDRYYMLWGSGGNMWALVADKPEGPFAPTARNRILLHAGPTYFARFFPSPDGLLACHHSIARNREVYAAPLKRVSVDAEGTLRFGWWSGNEAMKHAPAEVSLPRTNAALSFLEGKLDAGKGFILEGAIARPKSLAQRAGWFVECAGDRHGAMLLNSDGRVEFGPADGTATNMAVEMNVSRELDFGERPRFRLLVQGSLTELYLNDVLIECFSLPADASGRVGFVGRGVSGLKAWQW